MELLLIVAGFVLLPVAVAVRLMRRHRGVPRGWQTAQSEAAMLHRRLHKCVDDTREVIAREAAQGVPAGGLVSLTEDLHAQALAIDQQLVTASRLPDGSRHRSLMAIKQRIVESEKLAARIRQLAVDMASPRFETADEGMRLLKDRLEALDAARREAYEAGGLVRPPGDESGKGQAGTA
jgi:hypothetical protein